MEAVLRGDQARVQAEKVPHFRTLFQMVEPSLEVALPEVCHGQSERTHELRRDKEIHHHCRAMLEKLTELVESEDAIVLCIGPACSGLTAITAFPLFMAAGPADRGDLKRDSSGCCSSARCWGTR